MNNKGLGAVMGVILMVAITIAIAVVVYVYVTNFDYITEEEQLTTHMNNALELKQENCNCNLSQEFIDGWNSAVREVIDYYNLDDYNVTSK